LIIVEKFGCKEEVATDLMKVHEELCGTCQIRWEQNKRRQGFGWETITERTLCNSYATVGYECYGEVCVLAQLAHNGKWYGVLCPLYSVTYE
jgi:hypothetical protein